jgi:hypothetical protein
MFLSISYQLIVKKTLHGNKMDEIKDNWIRLDTAMEVHVNSCKKGS